jgi:hypothetical protein
MAESDISWVVIVSLNTSRVVNMRFLSYLDLDPGGQLTTDPVGSWSCLDIFVALEKKFVKRIENH